MDLTRHVKWLKPPVFLLCLAPLAILGLKIYHDTNFPDEVAQLGANPQAFIRNSLGFWTLVFLCITLAVTPARRLLHLNWLIRFRRMLGLFAFFYGSLHLITYVWLDTGFDWGAVLQDVYKRPFITAGFTSFVLMLPLAVTSTSGWVRRLGGKRWQLLHRLIYFSAIAGVVHYWWLVKSDITIPLRFAVVVGVLLAYRVVHSLLQRRRNPAPKNTAAKQPAIPA